MSSSKFVLRFCLFGGSNKTGVASCASAHLSLGGLFDVFNERDGGVVGKTCMPENVDSASTIMFCTMGSALGTYPDKMDRSSAVSVPSAPMLNSEELVSRADAKLMQRDLCRLWNSFVNQRVLTLVAVYQTRKNTSWRTYQSAMSVLSRTMVDARHYNRGTYEHLYCLSSLEESSTHPQRAFEKIYRLTAVVVGELYVLFFSIFCGEIFKFVNSIFLDVFPFVKLSHIPNLCHNYEYYIIYEKVLGKQKCSPTTTALNLTIKQSRSLDANENLI